jgi:hypothetical protein
MKQFHRNRNLPRSSQCQALAYLLLIPSRALFCFLASGHSHAQRLFYHRLFQASRSGPGRHDVLSKSLLWCCTIGGDQL